MHEARISHRPTTAPADMAALAALRSIGFLTVLGEYACVILSRKPYNHLGSFVTEADEKCGLE